jgi:hypothetical protein
MGRIGKHGWTYMLYPHDQGQPIVAVGMVDNEGEAKGIASGVLLNEATPALYAIVERACVEFHPSGVPDLSTYLVTGLRFLGMRNRARDGVVWQDMDGAERAAAVSQDMLSGAQAPYDR